MGQGETALLVGFPTPVAHGGDPQDRAGFSAGDCVHAKRVLEEYPKGDKGNSRLTLAPCPPIPHAPCLLYPMPNAQSLD
ncbi:MAG: hypothetical protein KME32_14000 [Mojavia pulchra JT2-VF2]|jgi:hypothetical protein|uniref:Uncharacterized protein n=1 Tax=Mojavia pulchra JT2-VF2 TaxID=287848 RepID=A0A951PXI7_9NOST|nr:hypothetical protein [Mojavia pulchra JT2-VF2]